MSTAAKNRLFFWLGPWSRPWTPSPHECLQEPINLPGQEETRSRLSRLRIFLPRRRAVGALFVIPGLHFQGFDHPELHRLVCSLAHAGFVVGAPDIPDFLNLRFHQRSLDDANTLFQSFIEHERVPFAQVGLLSISLGSRLAFSISARAPEKINKLITFGGYFDWKSALQFCLNGRGTRKHDPLNRPIIFAALQEDLPKTNDIEAVAEAWVTFARRTWGKNPLKNMDSIKKIANDWQTNFSPEGRLLFEQGLGIAAGGNILIKKALESSATLHWLDPSHDLTKLSCSYLAVHARNDDVVEYEQSEALVRHATRARKTRCILTGMYSHSTQTVPSFREMATEIKQLREIISHVAA